MADHLGRKIERDRGRETKRERERERERETEENQEKRQRQRGRKGRREDLLVFWSSFYRPFRVRQPSNNPL